MSNVAMMMGLSSGAGGWSADIANASYDGVSFDMSSEDTSAVGIVFGDNGANLYMTGNTFSTVDQYTLSTPYDITTASLYATVTVSQAANPFGIGINNDGTSIYVLSDGNDRVAQYSLSTPYDLTSYNTTPTNFSISGQMIYPVGGPRFNNDGTEMYLLGTGGAEGMRGFQYSLSTAFDVSTASYGSKSYSFASETSNPRDVAFNPDGTIMYMLDNFPGYGVYEYALSTAFDISTASYSNIYSSLVAQVGGPKAFQFNEDATKMYVLNDTDDTVYQYSV